MPTRQDHIELAELLGTVGQAMTTPVLVLDADTPADVAARELEQHGVWGAPVLHRGRVVGVVTLEEVLARALPDRPVAQLGGPFPRHERLLASLRVWQLMHAGPIVVAAGRGGAVAGGPARGGAGGGGRPWPSGWGHRRRRGDPCPGRARPRRRCLRPPRAGSCRCRSPPVSWARPRGRPPARGRAERRRAFGS